MDAIDRIRRFEAQLQAAMEDCDREVNRLHATWSGAAAEEHRVAHTRWRTGTQEMSEALRLMRGQAEVAHHNYSAAVQANITMWRL